MNLGLCIANLLKRYPAVDVPGIGVFRITHVPAVYDESEQVILPPSSQIELTAGASGGFPITKYLRTQRKIDEAKARQLLGQAIAGIMETMSRNGRVLLDGLGYLLADGASLLLKPFETGDFGWKPVGIPKAPSDVAAVTDEPATDREVVEAAEADVEPQEAVVAIEAPETPALEAVEAVVPEAHVLETAETTEEPHVVAEAEAVDVVEEAGTPEPAEGRSGMRTWGWLAACAALLIGGATWAWFRQPEWFGRIGITRFQGTSPDGQAGPAGQEPTGQQLPAVMDSIPALTQQADTPDRVIADGIAPLNTAADSAAAAPPPTPAKPAVTYEIIVGSFTTMAQADKYVAEMKAKGYTLHAIDSRMPGNRKKISWGSYATEEEAYRELARVQKTFEPGAWIAKVENR